MRPTWRVAGAVALGLVLEWYGTTSEVSWLFLLAAWAFALVAATAVYAAWNRSGLELTLSARGGRPGLLSPLHDLDERTLRGSPYEPPVFEGDEAEVEIGLRARRGARGPAWVTGTIGGRQVTAGTGLVTAAGWRHLEAVPSMRRGVLTATDLAVHTSDPLGFFSGRRLSGRAEVAVVYPLFATLTATPHARELEASVAAPRAGAGNELFGVREYRTGDSLRRIHWRSSARRGELVVREFEPPGVRTLGVFVDPDAAGGAAAVDQVARIAASEVWDCLRQGGRAVLWAPGQAASDLARSRDLWSLLEWLARFPHGTPPGGPADDPPAVSEVVMVAGSPAPGVVAAVEAARRRGAPARGWVVGDAEVQVDAPLRRAGTGWPL